MNTQITLSEASQMAGVSISTMRRWALEKQVQSVKVKDGTWRISKENLLVVLSTQGASIEAIRTIRRASKTMEAPAMKESTEYSLVFIREALERERRVNDELRKTLNEREVTIRALEAEMRAILQRQSENQGSVSRWFRK